MRIYELLEELERLGFEYIFVNSEDFIQIKTLDLELGVMKKLEVGKRDKTARILYSVSRATVLFNGERVVFEGEMTEDIYKTFLEYRCRKGVEIGEGKDEQDYTDC